jgi:hypothetical protein
MHDSNIAFTDLTVASTGCVTKTDGIFGRVMGEKIVAIGIGIGLSYRPARARIGRI